MLFVLCFVVGRLRRARDGGLVERWEPHQPGMENSREIDARRGRRHRPLRRRDDEDAVPPEQAAACARLKRVATVEIASIINIWLDAPSGGARMLAFDFDKTILSIHATACGISAADVPSRWQADVADLACLRGIVLEARRRGLRCGICSFGHAVVVRAYLSCIFADAPDAFGDSDILTPAAFGGVDGAELRHGKLRMLQRLASTASPPITDAASVLYFDDDGRNITQCIEAGFVRAFHTPQGFTRTAIAHGPPARPPVLSASSSNPSLDASDVTSNEVKASTEGAQPHRHRRRRRRHHEPDQAEEVALENKQHASITDDQASRPSITTHASRRGHHDRAEEVAGAPEPAAAAATVQAAHRAHLERTASTLAPGVEANGSQANGNGSGLASTLAPALTSTAAAAFATADSPVSCAVQNPAAQKAAAEEKEAEEATAEKAVAKAAAAEAAAAEAAAAAEEEEEAVGAQKVAAAEAVAAEAAAAAQEVAQEEAAEQEVVEKAPAEKAPAEEEKAQEEKAMAQKEAAEQEAAEKAVMEEAVAQKAAAAERATENVAAADAVELGQSTLGALRASQHLAPAPAPVPAPVPVPVPVPNPPSAEEMLDAVRVALHRCMEPCLRHQRAWVACIP